MNINELLKGFNTYLEGLNHKSKKNYTIGNKNDSIFRYSEEFKKYLAQQNGTDSIISSMTINDILNMELQEGQLVGRGNSDTDEDISNQTSVADIINNLLGNEAVKKVIDKDGNGISQDELEAFLNTIKNFDENINDISVDDLLGAAKAIGEGTFGNTEVSDTPADGGTSDVSGAQNTSGTNGSSGNSGAPTSNNSGADTNTPATNTDSGTKNYEDMSLSELEAAKTDKQSEVDEARKAIDTVNSEALEKEQAAQKEYDKVYDEILENNEELKSQFEEKRNENLENISNTENEIKETQADINKTDGDISVKTAEISDTKAQIGALDSQISALRSQKTSGENENTELNAKIDQQIAAAEAEKSRLENDVLPNLERELENLNQHKSEQETHLDELNTTLDGYKEEKGNIEQEIYNLCTDEEKQKIDEAKKVYEDTLTQISQEKEAAMTTAQANLDKVQGELDAINNQIQVKKTEDVKSTYSVSSLDNPEQLYKTLGLDKQGLDYNVFSFALEGYQNLEDKGNGILAIFNATGDKKCYIVDMKNQKFLYSTDVRLGSGGMGSSIQGANKEGSHATLSGFMKVGDPYSPNSGKFWKEGIRLIGLENGINDNALSKGVVIHYVKPGQNTTWGCMGIPPVMSGGKADHSASINRNREMFQTGTIVFTYPGDGRADEYKKLSGLYN